MALRTETTAGALLTLLLAVASPAAQKCEGVHIDAAGVGAPKHTWAIEDIRQLTIGPDFVRVQPYERKSYLFQGCASGLTANAYVLLKDRLDRRFVAAIADERVKPEWQMSVRDGKLLFGEDRIVFDSTIHGQSRTWRISDIDNVASGGEFDLIIT